MDRINDRPDMTSAVYRGYKASTQPTNQLFYIYCRDIYKAYIVQILFLGHGAIMC